MSSDYEIETRPSTLLDEWMTRFGMDKNRRTDEHMHHMSYVRVRDNQFGATSSRWIIGGISANPAEALAGSFQEGMKLLNATEHLGSDCANIDAVVLLSHGKGQFVFIDPENGEQVDFAELSETGKQKLREEDERVYQMLMDSKSEGVCRSRLVSIITESGLAADVSNWFGSEVQVERVEQWTGDGASPSSNGPLDNALMATFTMLHLIQTTIRNGYEVGLDGMMKSAMEIAQGQTGGDGDGKALAFLLRLIATGIDSGMLFEDD